MPGRLNGPVNELPENYKVYYQDALYCGDYA